MAIAPRSNPKIILANFFISDLFMGLFNFISSVSILSEYSSDLIVLKLSFLRIYPNRNSLTYLLLNPRPFLDLHEIIFFIKYALSNILPYFAILTTLEPPLMISLNEVSVSLTSFRKGLMKYIFASTSYFE